jgi:hypothetical protein
MIILYYFIRWNPALGFKYEEMRLEASFDAVRRDAMERLPALPFF